MLLRQHVGGDFRRQSNVVNQDRTGEALGEIDLALIAEDIFAGQFGDVRPGGKGVDGNPGLSGSDLDPRLRIIFWPAVFGWTLLGVWISTLKMRTAVLEENANDATDNKRTEKQKTEYSTVK